MGPRGNLGLMAIHVYVAFSSDSTEADLDAAAQSDSPEEIRKLSQTIEAANQVWRSWALETGGEVLEFAGASGQLRIPAERLPDLANLRARYGETLDSGVSLGVGSKPWEALLALKAARQEGGDRLKLYGPGVQEALAAREEDELSKADGPPDTELSKPSGGGGMTPPQEPEAPGNIPPVAEGSEHSENESLQDLIANQPPASDPHQQLGELASAQGSQDDQDQKQEKEQGDRQQGLDGLKNQVLEALKVFQKKKDELAAIGKQDPELQQALLTAVKSMTDMARQVFDSNPEQRVQKAEQNPIFAEIQARIAARKEKIGELVQSTHGSAWQTPTGFVAVGRDPHDIRQWRATVIGADGEPSHHVVSPDHAGALRTAAECGADLLGAPHQVLKKGEEVLGLLELLKSVPGALHASVEGFMAGLKALPKGDPQRGKFITAHMGHAPFLAALQTHPQGQQVHAMLTAHLNSVRNAGFRPGQTVAVVKAEDLMPGGKGDGRPDSDFSPEDLEEGIRVEMEEHGLDAARAREIAKDHLTENSSYYRVEKAALEAGKTGRHDLILPVGSQKDPAPGGTREAGKVKIQHEDGKTGWVSVRAGQVMSNDGHPISSRNPGGK